MDVVADYAELIRLFLDGHLSAGDFEMAYLRRFKSETRTMPPSAFRALDRLFAAVDAYCGDPELRDEGDLDEAGLRRAARRALTALSEPGG